MTPVVVHDADERIDREAMSSAWRRVPGLLMPKPSKAGYDRAKEVAEALKQGEHEDYVRGLIEERKKKAREETIRGLQWLCATNAWAHGSPGAYIIHGADVIGAYIQPPVLKGRPVWEHPLSR